jgi:hypothetical protein
MENSFAEEIYPLPFYRQSKLKWSYHVLNGIVLVIFIGFFFIPGKDQTKVVINSISILFSALFGFMWIVTGFYNKSYVRVTHETLEYKAVFGKRKVVDLKSIYQVKFFSFHGVTLLGIRSSDDNQKSIWKAIDKFFGYGYSITISTPSFSDVDFNKFALTIISKAKEYNSETGGNSATQIDSKQWS